MSTISKEQLFAAAPQTTTGKIEKLGGDIKIRALTRGARKAWMEAVNANDPDAMEILVVESLVEPALTRADVKQLNKLDEKVLDEIFAAISEYNGWGADDRDAAQREALEQVAAGELSVDEALSSFRP
jgi:hypothetical protein